jgi:hypothetical protein
VSDGKNCRCVGMGHGLDGQNRQNREVLAS